MLAALLPALTGLLAAAGVIALIVAFRPVDPDLGDTLQRLRRQPATVAAEPAPHAGSWRDRVGGWVISRSRSLPGRSIPYADLDLLGLTPARFAAQKLLAFLVGLILPPLLGTALGLLGFGVPLEVPAAFALLLGGLGWMLPHLAVRRDAKAARDRFARTITAYFDLVVLERLGGAGVASAITEPAALGRAPLFRRIRQTLERQRLERKTPWVALQQLADAIDLPQLRDLADAIELSGTKSTPIAETLRARARDIRNEFLNRDVERAAAVSQRQLATTGLLLGCFLAFMAAPSLLRLLNV